MDTPCDDFTKETVFNNQVSKNCLFLIGNYSEEFEELINKYRDVDKILHEFCYNVTKFCIEGVELDERDLESGIQYNPELFNLWDEDLERQYK